ncbi:MAG TPA: methyltransferase domain-containing protein [Ktedonobacterales bacterium]|nr:methyltransferase domain-containing protein [Ktedonobacterales bacterium]
MRRWSGLGLVALGIVLGVASLVALLQGATLYVDVLAALAVLAVLVGATLWGVVRVADRRSAKPTLPASGAGGQGATLTTTVGGRTHARGIPYVLPRDLEEMNRLDFQHYVLRQAFKGNFLAPVERPLAILDVGTGTGRWAHEVATVFPSANVIGLDLNTPPVDEKAEAGGEEIRPPNYAFVPGNILEGLPFGDASFDFVHMRLLVLALPHDRWPVVVRELVRVTRPGGWVESVEVPADERGGPAVDQIMNWVTALLQRRGIDIMDGTRVGGLLQAQGLVNVYSQRVEVPIGVHGGRVGRLMATDILNAMQALRGPLEAQGLTTAAEFDRTFAEARRAMESPRVRCVAPFYVAYGQQPGA